MAKEKPRNGKSVYSARAAAGNTKTGREPPASVAQYREEKKKRKKRLLLLLLLLLIGCLVIWFIFIGFERKPPDRSGPADITHMVAGGDVMDGIFTDGMTAEEIEAALQTKADKDNFTLQIASEMIFENGSSPGSIKIVNPQSNTCPMSVEVTLDRDGSVVYQSGLIKPLQFISSGKLMQNLPAGTYPALGMVTIYSDDGKKVDGMASVVITIIVRN